MFGALGRSPAAMQTTATKTKATTGTGITRKQATETIGIVRTLPQRERGETPTHLAAATAPLIGIPSKVAVKPTVTQRNFEPIQFPARIPVIGLLDTEQQGKLNKTLHVVVNQLIRADPTRLFHDISHADTYPIVIDLKSVRDRIRESLYHSLAELAADVRLMIINAKKFFGPETPQNTELVRFEMVAQRTLEKQRRKMDPLLAGDFSMVYSMTFEEHPQPLSQQQQQSEQQQQPAQTQQTTEGGSPSVDEVTLASGESHQQPPMISEIGSTLTAARCLLLLFFCFHFISPSNKKQNTVQYKPVEGIKRQRIEDFEPITVTQGPIGGPMAPMKLDGETILKKAKTDVEIVQERMRPHIGRGGGL